MGFSPDMDGAAHAWVDGWRRVRHAPAVLLAAFVLTFAAAVPFAVVIRSALSGHLGDSLEAAAAASGANWNWWQEFLSQASGLSATFLPRIVGFAATLDSLSALADARRETTALVGLLAGYLTLWTWLQGGIIDRYARQRSTGAHGFAGASTVFFFRFVRLGLMAAAIYWWLFSFVHPWLFDERYVDLTRGLDSERTAFLWRLAAYALFGVVVVAVNLVFDYARVRMVVEDRRSALGGLAAAVRFVRRRPRAVIALWCANALMFLVALSAWSLLAPGVVPAGVLMWLAFAAAQLFILVRLAFKLHFTASQTALFQASLAHARYAATPSPKWPESPLIEAVAYSEPR
jgi:hypothetical protein